MRERITRDQETISCKTNTENRMQKLNVITLKNPVSSSSSIIKLASDNRNIDTCQRNKSLWYFPISIIMIGKVMKYSIIFIISLLAFDLFHLYQYVRISNQARNDQKVSSQQLLSHLQYLTGPNLPFFRERFYQEYVYQLAKNKQWPKVAEQAEKALLYDSNREKFSLHYHKAMALCFLERFKQCKSAIQKAHIYSTKDKFQFIQNIYTILFSNNIVTYDEIPTGAQFQPPKKEIPQKKSKYYPQSNLQTL